MRPVHFVSLSPVASDDGRPAVRGPRLRLKRHSRLIGSMKATAHRSMSTASQLGLDWHSSRTIAPISAAIAAANNRKTLTSSPC